MFTSLPFLIAYLALMLAAVLAFRLYMRRRAARHENTWLRRYIDNMQFRERQDRVVGPYTFAVRPGVYLSLPKGERR